MSFFSVIIPLYNKEEYIQKTIESVLSQSFKDFELVIINDGSTDRSLEIVKSFTDSRIKIISTENSGLSATRNFGIDKANSEHIAFVDADDTWRSHHLEQLHSLILAYPNMGMYCTGYTQQRSNTVFHDAKFNGLPDNFIGIVSDFFTNSLLNCVSWVSAICVPKAVFKDIGVFDLEIYSEQDTDLYIRIGLKYNVALDNSSVSAIYNRTDNNSMSRDFYKRKIPKLFHVYKDAEMNHFSLKKFIDINRFSYGISLKMSNRLKESKSLLNDINANNLNAPQKLLLKLPPYLLRFLFYTKNKLSLNSTQVFKPN